VLRAAELLFHPQRMTLHEGSPIPADAETIAGALAARPQGSNARHPATPTCRRHHRSPA
jgi:hypothetical protein